MSLAQLYIRVTDENGKRKYQKANLKKQLINPGTVYVLRYDIQEQQPDGTLKPRRVWETVGQRPSEAKVKLAERELALIRSQVRVPESVKPEHIKPTLKQLRESFIKSKKNTRKRDGSSLDKETITAYEQQTEEFLNHCARYPEQITSNDLRRYMAALRLRVSHRTVCNMYVSVCGFLKYCGVDHKTLLPQYERPIPDDGVPEAYNQEQITKFFAACRNQREALFFETLWKSGLRERECTTLQWANIITQDGGALVRLYNKPELNFRLKTGKGRDIPIPYDLYEKLKVWHQINPGKRLLFGTKADKEDSHMLRTCKEIAVLAGFDQDDFWLHRWRDTYATTLVRDHVDIRTIQAFLGHADITMTQRYLSPATGREAQSIVNRVFNSSFTPVPAPVRSVAVQ